MKRIKNQESRIKSSSGFYLRRRQNFSFDLRRRQSLGFTLIELLTVIAIIGILTALTTVSFISVRQRARDTQRKADIKQIQSALELYRADNDFYPATNTFSGIYCGGTFSSGSVTYMSKVPCDPSSSAVYRYSQTSSTSYVIGSCLENTNDIKDGTSTQPSWWSVAWPPISNPPCTSTYYYVTQNP